MEGEWAAKSSKDKPHICWSQSGFLTGTGADRHRGPAGCALVACVAMSPGADTSMGFMLGREQDNGCGLITSSKQVGVGDGAGVRGTW